MERLKGKEILIGKEPHGHRLMIAVKNGGQVKSSVLAMEGSVPSSVSRCIPGEGKAHCKIAVAQDGSLSIHNLKVENVTYVNGFEIDAKRISGEANVSLGKEQFPVQIGAILETAKKILPSGPKSIKHLEDVWQEYETNIDSIAFRQAERGRRRMLPMIVGSTSGLIAPLLAIVSTSATLYVTVPISIISFVIYIKNYREKDTTNEDKKAALDFLIDNYVCPHCSHYLGNGPYKVLRQNKKCPYCGGEWTE